MMSKLIFSIVCFFCAADTHTKTKFLEVPPGDVLLHAGDFTSTGLPREVERFRDFLDALPHQHKVSGCIHVL